MASLEILLHKLAFRLNRLYLGPRWTKMPTAQWTDGLIFFESIAGEYHAHVVMYPPKTEFKTTTDFSEKVCAVWTQLVPCGELHSRQVNKTELLQVLNYVTKDLKWRTTAVTDCKFFGLQIKGG